MSIPLFNCWNGMYKNMSHTWQILTDNQNQICRGQTHCGSVASQSSIHSFICGKIYHCCKCVSKIMTGIVRMVKVRATTIVPSWMKWNCRHHVNSYNPWNKCPYYYRITFITILQPWIHCWPYWSTRHRLDKWPRWLESNYWTLFEHMVLASTRTTIIPFAWRQMPKRTTLSSRPGSIVVYPKRIPKSTSCYKNIINVRPSRRQCPP